MLSNADRFERERMSWERHGYYIHAERDRMDKEAALYSTRGILHSRGKPDLQIETTDDPYFAEAILRELVERMDQGAEISAGQQFNDVMPGVDLITTESVDDDALLIAYASNSS